jgi:protocatechuate 3,4-dioxygenase beta subunit
MLSFAARTGWWRGWANMAIILAISAKASFSWTGDAAAANVTGRVTDQGGNPVPNATVRLEPVAGEFDLTSSSEESDRYAKTTSSESGWYMLETLVPGKYRLTCGRSSSREIYVGIGVLHENCQQQQKTTR